MADPAFDDWLAAARPIATTDDRVHGSLYNLLAERRAAGALERVRAELAGIFARTPKNPHPEPAARAALDRLRWTLTDPAHPWLGQLPVSPADESRLPPKLVTFVTANDIAQYLVDGPFDLDHPPLRVRLSRYPQVFEPPSGGVRQARRRWVWVTAETADQIQATARDICCCLGLAQVLPDDYIYRISVDIAPAKLYIPSCLDAALNEAWCVPPDQGLPWGMTRHLETGIPCQIELLIETAQLLTGRPVAERVLGPGQGPTRIDRVGPIKPDFRIGRETLP